MFDLIAAINTSRKTYEAGVSIRAATISGGEVGPLKADMISRFKEQATAFGFMVEPIDDAAQASVEERFTADRVRGGYVIKDRNEIVARIEPWSEARERNDAETLARAANCHDDLVALVRAFRSECSGTPRALRLLDLNAEADRMLEKARAPELQEAAE